MVDQLSGLSGISERGSGLIAVQMQGYGEVDDEALNAQDIAGPEYAPAFSISRRDAALLKTASVKMRDLSG